MYVAARGTLRTDAVQAVVGASSVRQLEVNVGALEKLDFTAEELAEIDRYATESGIDIWVRWPRCSRLFFARLVHQLQRVDA